MSTVLFIVSIVIFRGVIRFSIIVVTKSTFREDKFGSKEYQKNVMVIPGLNIEMNLAHAWVMIDGLKTNFLNT
jgi:hypothetical protein